MNAREKTLIVGIGNELLGDEGFGVHVARALLALPSLPCGVEVMEAGTCLLEVLPLLPQFARVILHHGPAVTNHPHSYGACLVCHPSSPDSHRYVPGAAAVLWLHVV